MANLASKTSNLLLVQSGREIPVHETYVADYISNYFNQALLTENQITEILGDLKLIPNRSPLETVTRAVIEFGGKCCGMVFGAACAIGGIPLGLIQGAFQGLVEGAMKTKKLVGTAAEDSIPVAVTIAIPTFIVSSIINCLSFGLYGMVIEGPKQGWKFKNECADKLAQLLKGKDTPDTPDPPWLQQFKQYCDSLIKESVAKQETLIEKEAEQNYHLSTKRRPRQ